MLESRPTSTSSGDAPEETKKAPAVRADADWDTMSDAEKLSVWEDWREMSDEASIPWLKQARRSFRDAESDQGPDAVRGPSGTTRPRLRPHPRSSTSPPARNIPACTPSLVGPRGTSACAAWESSR